jgi:integrase
VVEEYAAADGLEALFRRIYDKAGLPECSSHAGRRTFASTLLANGLSSEDVQVARAFGA